MNRIRSGTRLLLLALAVVATSPGPALAATASQTPSGATFTAEQVSAAVRTWVQRVTAEARPDATIERLEPYIINGETAAFIVHLTGGGYCLAGADPHVLPVYFYTPTGSYDPANPELTYILDEIAARRAWGLQVTAAGADRLTATQQTLFADRQSLWDSLIAGRVPPRAGTLGPQPAPPSMLTLPVTSTWHQGSPYNDQLPNLTPGADERVIIGCNATATAQIMYYWKWPSTGVGTGSVTYEYRYRTTWDTEPLAASPTIPGDFNNRLSYDAVNHRLRMNGYWDVSIHDVAVGLAPGNTAYQAALGALWARMGVGDTYPSANFGATTYDWSLMKDVHTDPVDAGDIEVAKLNAHVAIAVDSNLGVWNTGSYFGNDVAGLRDHFRYDPDALFTDSVHNGGAGADIYSLTEEIQWGRPAALGGTNLANGGGHAWVIQGYNTGTDPNRQFLMNLGWGGNSDGWYTFDSCPFPDYHDMMTRIAPTNVKFVGANAAGDGSPATPYRNIEEALGNAPNGSTLIFKAGSVNQFAAATLVINRPLVLKGWGATVTK